MRRLENILRHRLASREPKPSPRRELRPAAVLIPILWELQQYKMLFTRRASSLRRQPGDISFPGGAIDHADPSPLAAALRESQEEIGLQPSDVAILGQMDEMATVTGFRITPFVGSITGPYPFRANHEVEELLLVPLAALRREGAVHIEDRKMANGRRIPIYHYVYEQTDIWGITGRLVKEVLDLLPPDI